MIALVFALLVSSGHARSKLTPAECFKQSDVQGSKTDRKYTGFKNLFEQKNISKTEILARLISAETKAAGYGCQEHAMEISHHIASVLNNRIQKRSGDILSVVFEPSQFASSLHFYRESAVDDFLCPGLPPAWQKIKGWAQDIEKKRYDSTLPPDTVNYFLYKHSERFKAPKWTKTLNETVVDEKDIAKCIRFFENKNFK